MFKTVFVLLETDNTNVICVRTSLQEIFSFCNCYHLSHGRWIKLNSETHIYKPYLEYANKTKNPSLKIVSKLMPLDNISPEEYRKLHTQEFVDTVDTCVK